MTTEVQREIKDAAANCSSMREAAASLSMPYRTFIERAKKLGVYAPNQGARGKPNVSKGPSKTPSQQIFVEGSTYSRGPLKRRLIEEKILNHQRCDICGMSDEWNGQKLNMHLDHINGVNNDNRIENLRFICPNCHSQTPTYCRGRSKAQVAE